MSLLQERSDDFHEMVLRLILQLSFSGLTMARSLFMIEMRGGAVW
jgi:hypothetical protein